jgi:hypothetical protein
MTTFNLPSTSPEATHPALRNVIFLISCSFGGPVLKTHVPYFLQETRQALRDSLAYADRLTHFLWASMALSVWLGKQGMFLESYVTGASLVRFALGCGLAGRDVPEDIGGGLPADDSLLPPPSTPAEAVERISVRRGSVSACDATARATFTYL